MRSVVGTMIISVTKEKRAEWLVVLEVVIYICCVLMLLTVPFVLRDARRGRAWLSQHAT